MKKPFLVHVEKRQVGVLKIEAEDDYHAYLRAKRYTKDSKKIEWEPETFILEEIEDPDEGITLCL